MSLNKAVSEFAKESQPLSVQAYLNVNHRELGLIEETKEENEEQNIYGCVRMSSKYQASVTNDKFSHHKSLLDVESKSPKQMESPTYERTSAIEAKNNSVEMVDNDKELDVNHKKSRKPLKAFNHPIRRLTPKTLDVNINQLMSNKSKNVKESIEITEDRDEESSCAEELLDVQVQSDDVEEHQSCVDRGGGYSDQTQIMVIPYQNARKQKQQTQHTPKTIAKKHHFIHISSNTGTSFPSSESMTPSATHSSSIFGLNPRLKQRHTANEKVAIQTHEKSSSNDGDSDESQQVEQHACGL